MLRKEEKTLDPQPESDHHQNLLTSWDSITLIGHAYHVRSTSVTEFASNLADTRTHQRHTDAQVDHNTCCASIQKRAGNDICLTLSYDVEFIICCLLSPREFERSTLTNIWHMACSRPIRQNLRWHAPSHPHHASERQILRRHAPRWFCRSCHQDPGP